jgi:hypothetical protein
MDLTKLSDADLLALQQNDLTKLSDEGLSLLKGTTSSALSDVAFGETGGGAATGRPMRNVQLNVQAQPRPLEAVGAGIVRGAMIDPVLGTAKLLSGGNVGQEASQRYAEESKPYEKASPIGFGVGRVGGSLLPASMVMKSSSMIPSFANSQLAQNIVTGTTMGLLTPENTGKTGVDFYKEQAKEGGIGAALGLIPTGVEKLSKYLRGAPQTPDMAKAIEQARASGYVIPPTQANPTMFNKTIEGISGKAATSQNASARNQLITNNLAKQALGLSDDTVLNIKTLEDIRKTAGQSYENLNLQGTIKTSPKFIQALNSIKPYKDAVQAAKDFPEDLANPIIKVVDSLKRPNFDINSAVSKISVLRNEADVAYRQGNTALGQANKKASEILENTIEAHLANTKQTDLLDKFKEARQLIAKTYSVQKAVNPVTGTVDAKKLASQLKAGKPLSGELKEVAEFSSRFPKATQTTESMGSLPQFSPIDYFAGVGGSIATQNPSLMVAAAGRPILRELALSSPIQNRLVQQAPKQASELARLLMLQPANQLIGE